MEDIINLRAQQTIDTIKQLIRYDIPVLILGVSSVGKSVSLIGLCERWRIKRQMLYIGSEKPENIEGLPKLHAEGEKLEYFKPYWFPDSDVITTIVTNGRNLFNKFIEGYYTLKPKEKFAYSYDTLNDLLAGFSSFNWGLVEVKKDLIIPRKDSQFNTTPFTVERKIQTSAEKKKGEYQQDDIRDICSYLTTLLGYGNFWLILDELDKVEEFDIDKYAPLLHIARERYLKGWELVEINDTKGINIPELVTGGDYTIVKEIIDRSINNGQSLLDTRVIAIANSTIDIEEALFRRFGQVFVEDMLVINKPSPAALTLKRCMIEQEIMPEKLSVPDHQILEDMNLQWVFNFFVKIINQGDFAGNYFFRDAVSYIADPTLKDKDPRSNEYFDTYVKVLSSKSAIYRFILSNFRRDDNNDDFQLSILRCLSKFFLAGITGQQADQDKYKIQRDLVEEYMTELDGDTKLVMEKILDDLQKEAPKKEKQAIDVAIPSITAWIDNAYSYIYVTMFEKGEFNRTVLNGKLIPAIHAMVLAHIASNPNVIPDDSVRIMTDLGKWWMDKKEYFPRIQADKKEVESAIESTYGADNAITKSSPSFNLAKKYQMRLFSEIVSRAMNEKGGLGDMINISGGGLHKLVKEEYYDYLSKRVVNNLRDGTKVKQADGTIKESKSNPKAVEALESFLK